LKLDILITCHLQDHAHDISVLSQEETNDYEISACQLQSQPMYGPVFFFLFLFIFITQTLNLNQNSITTWEGKPSTDVSAVYLDLYIYILCSITGIYKLLSRQEFLY
jgi:hypothetical protein